MKATSSSFHISELEQQMQQADADWEALTRSIQADQQRLAALEQHLDRFRLLFQPLPDEPAGESPAITARMELLEQHIAVLGQCIISQNARRNAIERQFEQARLARAILRRVSQRHSSRLAVAHKLLISCKRHLLRGFWAFLNGPACSGEIIPNDSSLRRHASTKGQ